MSKQNLAHPDGMAFARKMLQKRHEDRAAKALLPKKEYTGPRCTCTTYDEWVQCTNCPQPFSA